MASTDDRTVPPVIEASSGDFAKHLGRYLDLMATGAVVRVADRRSGRVRFYASRELPARYGALPVIETAAGNFAKRLGHYIREMSAGRVVVVIDRRMALVKCYASCEVPVRLEPVAHLLPPPVHANGLARAPEGYRRCCACNVLRPAMAEEFRPGSQGVLSSQCIRCEDRAARTRRTRKRQPAGSEVTA